MRRIILLLLAAAMLIPLPAVAFTDSLGRTVELPETLERIVPSGNLTQLVLYSIAPERIVGWSSRLSGSAVEYFVQDVVNLPVFGTFSVAVWTSRSFGQVPSDGARPTQKSSGSRAFGLWRSKAASWTKMNGISGFCQCLRQSLINSG